MSLNDSNLFDDILMDTVAMIHSYFVHSFDIDRLTKTERDRVRMESAHGLSLDDDDDKVDADLVELDQMKLTADILAAKQLNLSRGDRFKRFRNISDRQHLESEKVEVVDFAAMSKAAGNECIFAISK